jgi:hypothetical protein
MSASAVTSACTWLSSVPSSSGVPKRSSHFTQKRQPCERKNHGQYSRE